MIKIKNIFFPSIFLLAILSFLSCDVSVAHPSSIIAVLEILDNDNQLLEGVCFSATLDGDELSDLNIQTDEYKDESTVADENKNFYGFVYNTYTYSLFSDKIGNEKAKLDELNQDTLNKVLSRITITISKEGYKSVDFIPSASPGDICYKSIILEKTE